MTDDQSALAVVEALADAINRHDLDGIMRVLHHAHVFVDSLGNQVRGSEAVRKAWHDYLSMVPDYWVRIDHGVLAPEYIALFGAAGGTLAVEGKVKKENWWETTAAWRAVIVDGRIAKWEVYADNEPIRALQRRKAPKKKRAMKRKPGLKSRSKTKPRKKK